MNFLNLYKIGFANICKKRPQKNVLKIKFLSQRHNPPPKIVTKEFYISYNDWRFSLCWFWCIPSSGRKSFSPLLRACSSRSSWSWYRSCPIEFCWTKRHHFCQLRPTFQCFCFWIICPLTRDRKVDDPIFC